MRLLAAVALTLWRSPRAPEARAGNLFDDLEAVATELRADEPSRRRDAVDKLDAYRTDEVRALPLRWTRSTTATPRCGCGPRWPSGGRRLVEAAPRLVALMGDPEPRLRAAAATALGQVAGIADAPWPARAAHALERALGDAEHEVREAAVEAIGALPRPLAQAAAVGVTGRLDDDHPTVRQKAAVVLARLGEARAVIPLVGRLSDGSREVRMAALEALGELGDARAAPAMIRLLGDSAEEVREQAIQSLGRLKDARGGGAALRSCSSMRLEPLRGRAAVALGQVGVGVGVGERPPIPPWRCWWRRWAGDELRQPAREGLAAGGRGRGGLDRRAAPGGDGRRAGGRGRAARRAEARSPRGAGAVGGG